MLRTQTRAPQRRRSYAVIGLCLFAGAVVVLPDTSASQQQTDGSISAGRISLGVLPMPSGPGSVPATSLARGITLGIEEAQRSARLFGWDVVAVKPPESVGGDDAIQFLKRSNVTAIVGNLADTLQKPLTNRHPVMIAAGRRMRGAPCNENEFHVLPLLDSAQWNSVGRPGSFASYAGLLAWDSSLERFGAAQLNERYQRRFGSPMDEEAWAGWMSVKIVLDAVLRIKSAEPCALERFLLSADARFDGHKGVQLFFDPQTRELIQPLAARANAGEAELVDVMTRHAPVAHRTSAGTACQVACA